MSLIDEVKTSLRLSTDAYDTNELRPLIDAALLDLGIAGVDTTNDTDPLIKRAVVTYCRMHFGNPENYDRLKMSYDEQKAQMQVSSRYTDWGVDDD